jgi:hypothetical protein
MDSRKTKEIQKQMNIPWRREFRFLKIFFKGQRSLTLHDVAKLLKMRPKKIHSSPHLFVFTLPTSSKLWIGTADTTRVIFIDYLVPLSARAEKIRLYPSRSAIGPRDIAGFVEI